MPIQGGRTVSSATPPGAPIIQISVDDRRTTRHHERSGCREPTTLGRRRTGMETMTRAAMALLSVMLLVACSSADEQVRSGGVGPSSNETGAPSSATHDCPDPGPVPSEDQDPNPPVEVVVLSGDFGDEPWCLSVSERDDVGSCLSIRGGAAPEGRQLSSGACDGDLSELGWHLTGDPESRLVVYGHAAAAATHVRFFAAGGHPVDVVAHRASAVSGAAFFAALLPHGFFPDEGAAFSGEEELQRQAGAVGVAG